jgi:hypothetical protein
MLTEDHLIRMLNLAIAALLQIIGLKKAGNPEDALKLIDFTLEHLIGLRSNVIKGLEDERLYYVLNRNGHLDTPRLLIIADLFKEEGDNYALQGHIAESLDDYQRALRYYLEVFFNDESEDKSELNNRIEDVIKLLVLETVSSNALWPLAGYFEEIGAYARAEAVLHILAGRPDLCQDILPELVAFYQRLLEKPSDALHAGGLEREQVTRSLQAVRCGQG